MSAGLAILMMIYREDSGAQRWGALPELVHAGQQGHGAVPDIAGVVDKAVAHLHLGVLQPGGGVGVGDVQGALPDAARPPEVLLPLLPLSILQAEIAGSHLHIPCGLQTSLSPLKEHTSSYTPPKIPHCARV